MEVFFIMGRRKEKGNGEGTIYQNPKTELYIGQYVYNGKRYSVYQKKNEKKGDFKKDLMIFYQA